MFKKSLSLVLCLLMVLSVVIVLPASAADVAENVCTNGEAHDYSTAGQCKVCGRYEYIVFKPGNTTTFGASSTINSAISPVTPAYSSETGRIEAPTGGLVVVTGNMDTSKLYAPITISFDLMVNEVLLDSTSKSVPFPILSLQSNASSNSRTQELLALGATAAGDNTVEVMFNATPDRAPTGSDYTKGINDSSIYTMKVGETYSFFVLVDPVTLKESVYINGEYAGSASLDSAKMATTFSQNYKFRFGQQTVQSRYFFGYSLDNIDAALHSSISDAYKALPVNQIFSFRYDRWQSGFGYGDRPALSLGATTYLGSFTNMLPSSTAKAADGTVYATMSGGGAERYVALSTTSNGDTFNLVGKKYEIRVDFALATANKGTSGDIVRLYHTGDSKILQLVSFSSSGTLEAHKKALYNKEGTPLSFLTTVTSGVPASTTDLRIVVDEANGTYSIYVNGTVAYWKNGNHYDPFIDMPLSEAKSTTGSTPAYDYMRLFAGSISAILKEASVTLIPDSEIELVGSQLRTADRGAAAETFDLRFVFGVDDVYTDTLNFAVEAYRNGAKFGNTKTMTVTTVFKELNAGNGKLHAYRCPEGEYLTAFKITGIEEISANYIYTFKITPNTVDKDGNKILRETYEISYNGIGELLSSAKIENGVSYTKVLASDDAIIRAQRFGNTCYNSDRLSSGNLIMKNSVADTGFRREVLIRFDDIDLSKVSENNRVVLAITVTYAQPLENGDPNPIYVYGVSSDWSSDTVTYNTAPSYTNGNYVGVGYPEKNGVCMIDVTDYVLNAIKNGTNDISFRLMQEGVTVPESETTIISVANADETRHPALIFDTWEDGQTYSHTLLENALDNDTLWAYAQEMYDEWCEHYEAILARGTASTAKIQSNAADYTVTTEARYQKPTAAAQSMKTRLVSTLSGYTTATTQENKYGGDMTAERQEATGRYYTKKIDGRWWVIDPLGYPCYVRGINHLTYSYQNGSEYQKQAMLGKYGTAENWALSATRWLQDGFSINVYQTGHDSVDTVEDGISRILGANGVTGYASKYELLAGGSKISVKYNDILPVFDPAFAEYADWRVNYEIENYKGDKSSIFGYSSDNEIAFSDTFLTQYLTLDYTIPAVTYSYAVAWTWYKNMTGVENPRVEDIDYYSEVLGVDLQDLFLGFVYDRYYSVMSSAIKSHDPNALYLGVRGLTNTTTSEWYLRVTGYWCDVYCINYYGYWEADAETLDCVNSLTGKPLLITEFYAKGMDAQSPMGGSYANTDGAGWVVQTQTERGYFYQNFCLRLLECKECIGWMYFQYIDNDPYVNTTASNKGMVNCDLDTEVYNDFTEQMALVNQNVYSLIEYFDAKNAK